MGENTDISKLLRLKRHEQPPPGYFDSFLQSFQDRQRAELIHRPLHELIWDRICSIAPNFQVPQYAYATIAVCTFMLSAVILSTNPSEDSMILAQVAAPVSTPAPLTLYSQSPVAIGSTAPVSTQSGGSRPVQYVLQASPVKYEQPLSF